MVSVTVDGSGLKETANNDKKTRMNDVLDAG